MNKYLVRYSMITKSRCGSYIYNFTDVVEAESENDIKAAVKRECEKSTKYKRFTIRVKSFEKIA